MNFMEISRDIYEEKYLSGYGINYPESHVIRIFNYLERIFKISNEKM